MTTKTNKILNAFGKGKVLTTAQIKKQFGVQNVSAHISYIRKNYTSDIVTSRRNNKTYYGYYWAA